jgi:hypothetical protein
VYIVTASTNFHGHVSSVWPCSVVDYKKIVRNEIDIFSKFYLPHLLVAADPSPYHHYFSAASLHGLLSTLKIEAIYSPETLDSELRGVTIQTSRPLCLFLHFERSSDIFFEYCELKVKCEIVPVLN